MILHIFNPEHDMALAANDPFWTAPQLSTDATSGELHRRHHITANGFYRGRQVLNFDKNVPTVE